MFGLRLILAFFVVLAPAAVAESALVLDEFQIKTRTAIKRHPSPYPSIVSDALYSITGYCHFIVLRWLDLSCAGLGDGRTKRLAIYLAALVKSRSFEQEQALRMFEPIENS